MYSGISFIKKKRASISILLASLLFASYLSNDTIVDPVYADVPAPPTPPVDIGGDSACAASASSDAGCTDASDACD